jgi:hypothetical protein
MGLSKKVKTKRVCETSMKTQGRFPAWFSLSDLFVTEPMAFQLSEGVNAIGSFLGKVIRACCHAGTSKREPPASSNQEHLRFFLHGSPLKFSRKAATIRTAY